MSYIPLLLVKYLKTNSFFRFILVGIINTMVGLSVIVLLLNGLGFSYWSATFIGNVCGAAVSFMLNRTFTFKSAVPLSKGIPSFVFILFISYLLAYSISEQIVRIVSGYVLLPISKENVAVLLGMGLYTFINYFGQKYIVFAKTSSPMM